MTQSTVFNLTKQRYKNRKKQAKSSCNKTLFSKRGESIMEVLVAMLVFVISLTAITMIVRVSLNLSMRQIIWANNSQGIVNEFIADDYSAGAGGTVAPVPLRFIEFDADGVIYTGADAINAVHNVIYGSVGVVDEVISLSIDSFHPVP